MRIKKPKDGTKRIKTEFLFWPKRIGDEIRWLELATWEEKYHVGFQICYWYRTRWID